MLEIVLATIAFGIVIGTNIYWFRRTRRVRESLTVSRDHETTTERPARNRDGPSPQRTLKAASKAADCPPEDLPDRIRNLRNAISDEKNTNEALRERWAGYWLSARGRPAVDRDRAYAIAVTLPDGEMDDAQQIAKAALADETGIVLAIATGENAIAVSVGEALRDDYAADEIASELVDKAGGAGAGGSVDFASGGGADADALCAAATTIQDRLRETLGN